MPLLQWDQVMEIISPAGSIFLNQDIGDGKKLLVNHRKSVGRRLVRAARDHIPQGDGEIFHDRYATGYEMQVCVRFMQGDDPACDEALCEMRDELYGILWSLLRPTGDGGRLAWASYCAPSRRMLDAARLLSISDPEEDAEEGATEVTFVLDSPFPYAITEAQDVTTFSGTQTVPNDGNVEFWPVIKVHASGTDCGAFTLESDIPDEFGNNLLIEFDSSYSGVAISAGSYGEIDTFRGTMFEDGNGADLSGGLVAISSDFFPIKSGGTSVSAIGAGGFSSAEFLTNDAWA
jgi:hypothetical protein